jgi:hypothetical protein
LFQVVNRNHPTNAPLSLNSNENCAASKIHATQLAEGKRKHLLAFCLLKNKIHAKSRKSGNVPDAMKARTTVAIGAIILAVAGAVVAVHHFKRAPRLPNREHFARPGGPVDSPLAREAVHYTG